MPERLLFTNTAGDPRIDSDALENSYHIPPTEMYTTQVQLIEPESGFMPLPRSVPHFENDMPVQPFESGGVVTTGASINDVDIWMDPQAHDPSLQPLGATGLPPEPFNAAVEVDDAGCFGTTAQDSQDFGLEELFRIDSSTVQYDDVSSYISPATGVLDSDLSLTVDYSQIHMDIIKDSQESTASKSTGQAYGMADAVWTPQISVPGTLPPDHAEFRSFGSCNEYTGSSCASNNHPRAFNESTTLHENVYREIPFHQQHGHKASVPQTKHDAWTEQSPFDEAQYCPDETTQGGYGNNSWLAEISPGDACASTNETSTHLAHHATIESMHSQFQTCTPISENGLQRSQMSASSAAMSSDWSEPGTYSQSRTTPQRMAPNIVQNENAKGTNRHAQMSISKQQPPEFHSHSLGSVPQENELKIVQYQDPDTEKNCSKERRRTRRSFDAIDQACFMCRLKRRKCSTPCPRYQNFVMQHAHRSSSPMFTRDVRTVLATLPLFSSSAPSSFQESEIEDDVFSDEWTITIHEMLKPFLPLLDGLQTIQPQRRAIIREFTTYVAYTYLVGIVRWKTELMWLFPRHASHLHLLEHQHILATSGLLKLVDSKTALLKGLYTFVGMLMLLYEEAVSMQWCDTVDTAAIRHLQIALEHRIVYGIDVLLSNGPFGTSKQKTRMQKELTGEWKPICRYAVIAPKTCKFLPPRVRILITADNVYLKSKMSSTCPSEDKMQGQVPASELHSCFCPVLSQCIDPWLFASLNWPMPSNFAQFIHDFVWKQCAEEANDYRRMRQEGLSLQVSGRIDAMLCGLYRLVYSKVLQIFLKTVKVLVATNPRGVKSLSEHTLRGSRPESDLLLFSVSFLVSTKSMVSELRALIRAEVEAKHDMCFESEVSLEDFIDALLTTSRIQDTWVNELEDLTQAETEFADTLRVIFTYFANLCAEEQSTTAERKDT